MLYNQENVLKSTSKRKSNCKSNWYLLLISCLSIAILITLLFAFGSNLPSPESPLKRYQHHNIRSKNESNTNELSYSSKIDNNNNSLIAKKQHRIAIIIPYLPPSSNVMFPDYISIFFRTAHGSSSLIDFLIIHNGQLSPFIDESTSTIQDIPYPSNVIFINLQSTQEMIRFFLRVTSTQQRDDLDDTFILKLSRFVANNPYSLVEYKPALGYIFQQFIPKDIYSHWGYADLDTAYGDLPRWITHDELENYDIVTYSYGDQDRLYLRGQFTFHKNVDKINNLWRKCDYLQHLDTRFQNVFSGKNKSLRLESAEGCYSYAVLTTNDIKVKYAVKGSKDFVDYVDSKTDAVNSKYGVFISIGKNGDRSVIYKAGKEDGDGARLTALSTSWFEEDTLSSSKYSDYTQPIQWEVGEMTPIQNYAQIYGETTDKKCMYWAPSTYQPYICMKDVNHEYNVFFINGSLYKQKYEQISFPNNVVSKPFFHIQTWKRQYRRSFMLPLYHDMKYYQDSQYYKLRGWVVLEEGILPILPKSSQSNNDNESLKDRISYVEQKNRKKIEQLPSSSFCLVTKSNDKSTSCKQQISWRHKESDTINQDSVTIIQDSRHLWKTPNFFNSVTLSLTLQIVIEDDQSLDLLVNYINLLESNLLAWGVNPAVVVLHVAGATSVAFDKVKATFQEMSFDETYPFLIGVIFTQDKIKVSRKALINLAESACSTRWIVSGLEVERGLIISEEMVFFAKRAAFTYGSTPGNVFVVPQFAATDDTDLNMQLTEDGIFSPISIVHFLPSYQRESDSEGDEVSLTSSLSMFDCDKCADETLEDRHENIENQIDQVWFELTRSEISFSSEPFNILDEHSINVLGQVIDGIQLELFGLLSQTELAKVQHFDKSPILMMDMLGSRDGMVTSELVQEVEEFGGSRCMNVLRVAQLSALEYKIRPLTGAFAISTTESRASICDQAQKRENPRCDGCFMVGNEKLFHSIARQESVRPTKIALLWNEMNLQDA